MMMMMSLTNNHNHSTEIRLREECGNPRPSQKATLASASSSSWSRKQHYLASMKSSFSLSSLMISLLWGLLSSAAPSWATTSSWAPPQDPQMMQTRSLAQEAYDASSAATDDDASSTAYPYDLSEFSWHYDKCQYIKTYSEERVRQNNQDGTMNSPLALRSFVLFRMCPTDRCLSHSCHGSNTVSGQYVVDLDTYLAALVQTQQNSLQSLCQICQEEGACYVDNNNNNNNNNEKDGQENNNGEQQQHKNHNNNNNVDCSPCKATSGICYQYQNLASLGYVDAAQYIQCQALYQNNNNEQNQANGEQKDGEQQQQQGDDQQQQQQFYIGPRCNHLGNIEIAVFFDQYCSNPAENMSVSNLLGLQLWYKLLSQAHYTYTQKSMRANQCVSCNEADNNNNAANNQRDQKDGDSVTETCEQLYTAAAKCESSTGLSAGFWQTSGQQQQQQGGHERDWNDGDEYTNSQAAAQETTACTFIQSLLFNSYTEQGEINYKAKQDVIVRKVTRNQKLGLAFLLLVIATLFGLMEHYQRRIMRAIHQRPHITFLDNGDDHPASSPHHHYHSYPGTMA